MKSQEHKQSWVYSSVTFILLLQGHINLGKKGYHVPNKGTVQVTLFNPHGTVVKMFVVMYDLSDMPPNSRTFVRQRTLNMPVGASDSDPNAHQWLRYLIHLRYTFFVHSWSFYQTFSGVLSFLPDVHVN